MKTATKEALIIISVVLIFIVLPVATRLSERREQIVVREKIDGKDGYFIFTDSQEYEVKDSLLFFNFDSRTDFRKLEEGKKYSVRVYGWRVPFLSWSPVIIEADLMGE